MYRGVYFKPCECVLLQEQALVNAAEGGDLDRVRYLLDHGVPPDKKTKQGGFFSEHPDGLFDEAPLHQASLYGQLQVAKLLLERGASVAVRAGYEQQAPLIFATRGGKVRVVELLLANSADPLQKDKSGETALHFAVKNANLNLVKLLLSHGADPFLKNKARETPLSLAIAGNQKGNVELFQRLDPDGRAKVRLRRSSSVKLWAGIVASW